MKLEDLVVGDTYAWMTKDSKVWYTCIRLFSKEKRYKADYCDLPVIGLFKRNSKYLVSTPLTLSDVARLKSLDEVFYE